MAAARLCMRQIKEVFRLHFCEKKSQSEIATHLGVGKTTVREYLHRINKNDLSWPEIALLDDIEIERKLGFKSLAPLSKTRLMPDWALVHREMTKPHVTLALLWTEYRETGGPGEAYGYTQFCEHYNRWAARLSVVMRQAHKAGEKTFIDYSGDGLCLVDQKTGEKRKTELFVACLGASSYTFAEATLSQTLPDWVSSHVRMAAYFSGVSEIWVPDNLKSGLTRADRYEPLLNETYRECASHYGACVIPARASKPRDKAKVAANVLVAQRWILARLRNRLFTSLHEMNEAIGECLEILNKRKMRHVNKSRHELFEEIDKPALKQLPVQSYEYAEWTPERVIAWSKSIGPSAALLVEKILSTRVHPQQGFMAAMGLIRLATPYGKERVERASTRALEVGAHSYQFVKEMLKNKMDGVGKGFDESPMAPTQSPTTNEIQLALLSTENIRGGSYYSH